MVFDGEFTKSLTRNFSDVLKNSFRYVHRFLLHTLSSKQISENRHGGHPLWPFLNPLPTPVLKNTLWPYPQPTPVQAYSCNTFSKYNECKIIQEYQSY